MNKCPLGPKYSIGAVWIFSKIRGDNREGMFSKGLAKFWMEEVKTSWSDLANIQFEKYKRKVPHYQLWHLLSVRLFIPSMNWSHLTQITTSSHLSVWQTGKHSDHTSNWHHWQLIKQTRSNTSQSQMQLITHTSRDLPRDTHPHETLITWSLWTRDESEEDLDFLL